MDDSQRLAFEELAKETDELIDTVETALEEHAAFSFMLATRLRVDALSKKFRELLLKLDEKDRFTVERTTGRKVVDLQKMSQKLPTLAVGKPAEKAADTGFFGTRAGTTSRKPVQIGEGARKDKDKLKVAGEVDAWCGRCLTIRTQTIAAMVGDQPAQVVCPVCGGRSRFREGPMEKKKPASKTEGAEASAGSSSSSGGGMVPSKEKRELLDSLRTAENVRTYAPKERYKAGEIIEHPEHGRGKIENVLPRSLLVRFASGLKPLKLS
jgi:hypothetical protein